MSEPFLGEIRMFSFNFPPKGWMVCNGALLPINQWQALFSLLGTTYGGNGQTNFALPDLRGRAPMHVGGAYPQGQLGGEQAHTLSSAELPQHSHAVTAGGTASTAAPAGARWAASVQPVFGSTPTVAMAPSAVSSAGSSQAHDNMPPYLVINFCIAAAGIFPSRN